MEKNALGAEGRRCGSIPAAGLACDYGWITAENGRQPWSVFGWLPTFMAASTHTVGYMVFSLIGFAVALHASSSCAELYLMFKYARLGPGGAEGADGARASAGRRRAMLSAPGSRQVLEVS